MGCRITGLGRTEGELIVTNADLEARLDTSDEWIRSRTGIGERRAVGPGQSTATMAAEATRHALKQAGRDDVDLLIVATTTPETICPSTASWVQQDLGITGGAFDLQAACSGWVYSVVIAAGLIQTGVAESVGVVGSESLSNITDPTDRGTALLFGDAAGAAIVEKTDGPGELLASDLGNDGTLADLLFVPAGGSRQPLTPEAMSAGDNFLSMNGREIFRNATRLISETCSRTLDRAGLTSDDVDLFVPHQANGRIISYACDKLGMPLAKTMLNLEKYGNTSSASIPVALAEAHEDERMKPGDIVLLAGFGAGMSWASAVLEWGLEGQARATS